MALPASFRAAGLLLGLSLPALACAQTAPADPAPPPASEPAPADPAVGAEIVVTAPSARDQVIGNGVPDIRIGRQEIATYGSASIGELLTELKPQTGEAPVILVNGRRVAGVGEIARLPPEAIARVDILPEEIALAYGYRADQKVVNVVLERRFSAATVQARDTLPTAGGRGDSDIGLNLVRIADEARTSFDLGYTRASKLTEAERGLGGPDAPFRTLMPSADSLELGATLHRPVARGIAATLTGQYQRRTGESLFGLAASATPALPGPAALAGHTRSDTVHVGAALNGRIAPWYWSFTGAYDHSYSLSRTDRDAPGGGVSEDRARSLGNSLSGDLVANGPIAELPAGKLAATLKAGIARRIQQSDSLRGDTPFVRDTANNQAQLSANINVPIASRRDHVLAPLGDLSANINIAHEGVSGIGGADTIGYGASWSPLAALRVTATIKHARSLPPQAQRDDPQIVTPNVPVYDFVTGETALVSRIDGGNPALRADRRHIFSLTANLKPFAASNLTLNLGYTRSRTRDQIGPLPAVTAAIEAAFPERFMRDPAGELTTIDARPVNFARARQQQLSWGLFWSKPLGSGREDPGTADRRGGFGGDRRRDRDRGLPPPDGAAPQDGPTTQDDAHADGVEDADSPRGGFGERAGEGVGRGPGAAGRGGFGQGGFGRGGGGRGRQGRVLLSFNHIWRIQNDILIRDGLPLLDLLGGDAFGGRGQARHQLNARANLMKGGLGLALEANWQSGSRLKGTVSTLRFSDLATADLRLFVNLGQQRRLAAKHPFFRGARLSVDIDNLFDAHMRVRDEAGVTPLGYSAAYLDPLGRSVRLSLRKLF